MKYTFVKRKIMQMHLDIFYYSNDKLTNMLNAKRRNHETCIITQLALKGDMVVSDIRKYVLCSERTFDASIKTLREQGFIKDVPSDDKRQRLTTLTPLSHQFINSLFKLLFTALINR